MQIETAYSFGKTIDLDHPTALAKAREALASQGFGILTEIDVQAKFKEKLGIDYRPYVILGACNPKLAHRALGHEIELGTLLPCNVVVYVNDAGQTTVSAMDPAKAMQMIGNPDVTAVAGEVKALLTRAMEQI